MFGLLLRPPPGTWPANQACALTRSQTSDLPVCGTTPSPRSHISQGTISTSNSALQFQRFLCIVWMESCYILSS